MSRLSRTGRRARAAAAVGALAEMSVVPAVFFALFVSPRIRTSGATTDELSRTWPGDELVPHPGFVWTDAMTIERPAADVWAWVTQLGQGRGGLYSYDWLENAVLADVHSVSELVPELQRPLKVADRAIRMTRYAPYNPVARYDPGRALVLGGVTDSPGQLRAGRPSGTWAFIAEPADTDRCRLVVRSRASGLAARLQGPIQFVMQRRMMLGIKQQAEGTWSPSAADVLIPLSLFTAAAAAAVHGVRALLPGGRGKSHHVVLAGLAGVGVQVLLFWDVPAVLRASLVAALAGSPPAPARQRMTARRRPAVAAVAGGALLALGIREGLVLRDADDVTARGRARQLGQTRIAAAAALLLRPRLLTGALGLETAGAAARWLPRLLAVREIGLGIGALASSRPHADPWPWLMTIGAVDGAEAVVLAAALRQRAVDSPGGWAFTAADLGSACAVVLRAARLRKHR